MCFNAFFIIQRFAAGLPLGEDATSHLYKIIYACKSFQATGSIPQWSNLWYAGHPIFLYYPPLSYFLVLGVTLIGLDSVTAFKIVDAFFFLIAPLTIYFLARKLQLSKNESLLSALLFTVTPSVVENYYFFDRYPTTISISLIALFIIFFIRVLEKGKLSDMSLLAALSAITVLVHPLSAYALLLIVACFALYYVTRQSFHQISKLILAAVGAFLASAFWLLPLVDAMQYQSENPFTNHSLYINYIDVPHLGHVIFLFGIFQFLSSLAIIRLRFFDNLNNGKQRVTVSLTLFILGALSSTFFSIQVGQLLIAAGFIMVLFTLLQNRSVDSQNVNQSLLSCAFWLILFFWLSLGSNALLIQALPFWQKLDNMRFFVYASIPQAILAGKYLSSLLEKTAIPISNVHSIAINRKSAVTLICLGIIVSFSFGAVAANLNRATSNTEIPQDIIQYFGNSSEEGRILPIECPKWIHLLPVFTDTPLIDGWFPQAKVLKPLLEINDYRINDLIDHSPEERVEVWQTLISNYKELGINWVMIGNNRLYYLMEDNSDFYLAFSSEQIRIYEAEASPSLVETYPQDAMQNLTVTQRKPDEILITIQNLDEPTTIIIKQAYMPYWTATSNSNSPVQLGEDLTGYIEVKVGPAENSEVTLNFSYQQGEHLYMVSIIVFATLFLIPLFSKLRSRDK